MPLKTRNASKVVSSNTRGQTASMPLQPRKPREEYRRLRDFMQLHGEQFPGLSQLDPKRAAMSEYMLRQKGTNLSSIGFFSRDPPNTKSVVADLLRRIGREDLMSGNFIHASRPEGAPFPMPTFQHEGRHKTIRAAIIASGEPDYKFFPDIRFSKGVMANREEGSSSFSERDAGQSRSSRQFNEEDFVQFLGYAVGQHSKEDIVHYLTRVRQAGRVAADPDDLLRDPRLINALLKLQKKMQKALGTTSLVHYPSDKTLDAWSGILPEILRWKSGYYGARE
jgi:hypothetical protein